MAIPFGMYEHSPPSSMHGVAKLRMGPLADERASSIGHCGVTTDAGDCLRGTSGSWPLASIHTRDLNGCMAHCLAHCPRCRFISFSEHRMHRECSWYFACPRLQWAFDGTSYRTVQVRKTPDLLPPPPPLPAFAAPVGAFSGYCALMGSALGDCDRSDQGSWRDVRSPADCVQRCASCERCQYVSTVLSQPYHGGRVDARTAHRAPYWWGCRWFSRCDISDLRRSPPNGEAYVSVRPDRSISLVPVRNNASDGCTHLEDLAARQPPQRCLLYDGDRANCERSRKNHLRCIMKRGKCRDARYFGESKRAGMRCRQPLPTPSLLANNSGASSRVVRLAIVTLASHPQKFAASKVRGGYEVACALAQWCQNARRLQSVLPSQWEVDRLVLGASESDHMQMQVAAGCDLVAVPLDEALRSVSHPCARQLALQHSRFLHRRTTSDFELGDGFLHETTYFKRVMSYKWQLFSLKGYDAVIFADADLELMPLSESRPARVAQAWVDAMTGLLANGAVQLVGAPDTLAPLNGGLMLLKPSSQLYHEGLDVLRACQFNRSVGWEHVGQPRSLDVLPHGLTYGTSADGGPSALSSEQFLRRLRSTRAYRTNSWDFPSADIDQGFFFYMLFVKHHLGAFGVEGASCPLMRHWWSAWKPWREAPLSDRLSVRGPFSVEHYRAWMLDISSLRTRAMKDPMQLAKLYDYTIREHEPGMGSVFDSATVALSPCLTAQRRLRQAIEQHTHFDEIFLLWQEHQWLGQGYTDWPEVPCR